jgi:hypothetical protein
MHARGHGDKGAGGVVKECDCGGGAVLTLMAYRLGVSIFFAKYTCSRKVHVTSDIRDPI